MEYYLKKRGHAACSASLLPSALRPTKSDHGAVPQLKINYEMLARICQLDEEGKCPKTVNHELFMKQYQQLFSSKCSIKRQKYHKRYRTVQGDGVLSQSPGHGALPMKQRRATIASEGKDTELSPLRIRLNAIGKILQKHPPLRSQEEVLELSVLLMHFPSLPSYKLSIPVRDNLATRIVGERVRERQGVALPCEGGMYLILQGTVQEISKDEQAGTYKTRNLGAGSTFGKMIEQPHPLRHRYPIYLGMNRCYLMRITLSDFKRSSEVIAEKYANQRFTLLNSSQLLSLLPASLKQKLARAIEWKTYPPNTRLLEQGRPISTLRIISSGQCKVIKEVEDSDLPPGSKVSLGEMGPGDVVGELVFDGCQTSAYTVVTTSCVTVGEIQGKELKEYNLPSLKPPGIAYSIVLPSKEDLREMFSRKQIQQQWAAIRKNIIKDLAKKT